MRAKDRESTRSAERPLLLVDIDGVISLFARDALAPIGAPPAPPASPAGVPAGAPASAPPASASLLARARPRADATVETLEGALHSIDGILHYLSATAARHLLALAGVFDLVWASGWEEKADEYLPHLLGVPPGLPFLRFAPRAQRGSAQGLSLAAHWKLEAVEAYAREHALAWIDDAFNDACHAWADARSAPTLLVSTTPERGLTHAEASCLKAWAAGL